jgi:uncharacterized membrane protein YbhN (UPF0104 family)
VRLARRRPLVVQTLFLIALLIAAAFVINGLIPGSGRRLDNPAVGWILAGVGVESLGLVAYAFMFHSAFADKTYPISFGRSTQIAMGEVGAFLLVPTGAGGPALRLWALVRSGMPWAVTVTRSMIQAVIFNAPYLVAALVLGITVVLGVSPSHANTAVALAPLGIAAVTIAAIGGLMWYAHARPTGPTHGWRRLGWEALQAVPVAVRGLPAALRKPVLVLGATAYWAGDCIVLILAFHAAHGSAPVGVIVPAYMLGQLGNALPLPGGVGGVEPIMLGVLTASGVGAGLGAAAIIFARFVSLGMQVAVGTIATVLLLRALGPADGSPAENE